MAVVKNLVAEAEDLCKKDAEFLSAFLHEADLIFKTRTTTAEKEEEEEDVVGAVQIGVGGAKGVCASVNVLKASVDVLRKTFITLPKAGGGTTLRALIPASTAANIRAIGSVTAGVGIALDAVTLGLSAHSLATNERDSYAEHLLTVVETLQKELDDAMEKEEEKNEKAIENEKMEEKNEKEEEKETLEETKEHDEK